MKYINKKFITAIGSRNLKHGGMTFDFHFTKTYHNAEKIVIDYMTKKGYNQGKQYNISTLNDGAIFYALRHQQMVRPFIINFTTNEHFIMAKMEGIDNESTM